MSRVLLNLVCVLIAVAISSNLFAYGGKRGQKELKRAEKESFVEKALDIKDYKITVDRVLAAKGQSIALTSSYSMSVDGESVDCDMPYFGKSYNNPYGGALLFEEPIRDYKETAMKKGVRRVEFKTTVGSVNYTFNVEVCKNGTSEILVRSDSRDAIRFFGEISFDKE